jgi:hypothetical protein
MNLQDALTKVGQILDEERVSPTVSYGLAAPAASAAAPVVIALRERGAHRRTVQERPANFVFRSANFELLCALLDEAPDRHRQAVFDATLSRISNSGSFHDRSREPLGAGQWQRSSSELPLVAEFNVRRGEKRAFIAKLRVVALSPGLTHLLVHLGEMIALNFTAFSDDEYNILQTALEGVRARLSELQEQVRPRSTIEKNVVYNVSREVPPLLDAVTEECRQARYLYLKSSLQPVTKPQRPIAVGESLLREAAPAALPSQHRFQIALSFPGEVRHRVEKIAEILSASVPKAAILYDKWLDAELARPGLDVYLTDLYKNHSLLLVFFLCADYARKEWCGLEWRIARDLIKQKQEHRLMSLRLDDAEIPGFHSVDGYLDIRSSSDAEVAEAVLKRLAMLTENPSFSEPVEPQRVADIDIPDPPEYWQQRNLLGPTAVFDKIQQRPRWCIWVRPAEFKRARFRDLEQCTTFMRSFASRGRRRYPLFLESCLEKGDDWIACETEDNGKHHSYLERWVLFRSSQFVQNLALDQQAQLGDRTHVLEILDRVTAAYECAAAMAKDGVLPDKAALTLSFYDVDGRQLTWPKDNLGYQNHVGSNCWSQDDKFEIRRIVSADGLAAERWDLALETAISIYAAFGWSDPPRSLLKSEQARRFESS